MKVHSVWFQHFAREFEKRVGDAAEVDSVLRQSGLTRSDLSPSVERVDSLKEAGFIHTACETLNDPGFAAEAGSTFDVSTHLVGCIIKYSQNLRAAIENASRFSFLVDATARYSLTVAGNHASFEVEHGDDRPDVFNRRVEFAIFCVISRMHSITGVGFLPLELRFRHFRPYEGNKIKKQAGCPVVFGAEKTEIILPLSSLDLPIPTYDPALKRHLTEYAERLLKERPKTIGNLKGETEELLLANLPGRILPADEVASNLGMSRRTFARRLKEQGLNFREIVDGVRSGLSREYLRGGISISEVAFYLDYADQASFSTAFKRWTGTTPGAFQHQDTIA